MIIKTRFSAIVMFFVIFFCIGCTRVQAKKPNVIFIMLDDLGYSQIEAYARSLSVKDCDPKFLEHVRDRHKYTPGQAFEMVRKASPTLSRMADQGVRFNNAFACSNLCAPSRIGIATGILPNRWGIYRNIDTEAHGFKPHSHLAEKLQARGYATAHIGKWHMGSWDDTMLQSSLKKHGIRDEEKLDYWKLKEKYPKIAKELRLAGYEGSVNAKDHPLNNGFDYYYGYNKWDCYFYNADNVWENHSFVGIQKKYNTDVFSEKALRFMERSIEKGKPFFVQVHYHAVHGPLEPKAPDKYFSHFSSGDFILDNFYAHIYAVDENIRKMEEFLKTKDQDRNTLFVFTSDHGGAVGNRSCLPGNAPYTGHKGMLLQGGFRTPLFFYWPDKIKNPLQKDQLVSTIDILPTIVDAAGGELSNNIDGKSLLPQILNNDSSPVHDHLAVGGIHARVWGFMGHTSFFTHNVSREKAPSGYVVIDDQYILRYVSETIPDLYKDAVKGIPAHYELYDYVADPGERNNLVEQHPEKVQQLKDIWKRESIAYPKPVEWGVDKWEAMINN